MLKVDCYCAALYRQNFVVETVKSLLQNPEVGTITIIANKHTDEEFENCKNGLLQANTVRQIPIYLHRGDNSKESNHKLAYLHTGKNPYICLFDNDIVYPPDYLKYLISGCETFNAYVSLHGVILHPLPIKSYYANREVYRGLKTVLFNTQVDLASNCGSLFKREFFTEEFYENLFAQAPSVSMDDIIMACACQQRSIPRWVLKHSEGYLKHKVQYVEDEYCFTKYTKQLGVSDRVQTDYINNNFLKNYKHGKF